jgi:hypothetical protein
LKATFRSTCWRSTGKSSGIGVSNAEDDEEEEEEGEEEGLALFRSGVDSPNDPRLPPALLLLLLLLALQGDMSCRKPKPGEFLRSNPSESTLRALPQRLRTLC